LDQEQDNNLNIFQLDDLTNNPCLPEHVANNDLYKTLTPTKKRGRPRKKSDVVAKPKGLNLFLILIENILTFSVSRKRQDGVAIHS
jgi:hypothetical protein